MKEHTINFHGSMHACLPRMLWQGLFDVYRKNGGQLDNLDNLLIDYQNCIDLFSGDEFTSISFLWGFCRHSAQTTWIYEGSFINGSVEETYEVYGSYDVYVLCEVGKDKATLKIVSDAVITV